jgi:hypothetical protein
MKQLKTNQLKHKCELEYTPFLSLLCPWRLDGVGFPAGARCFSSPQRPDRLWGQPSLLFSEYRGLFLGGL